MTKAKKMAARTIESYLPSLCLFEALLEEEIEDVAASSAKCHDETLPDSEWVRNADALSVACELNHGVACNLFFHLFGCFNLPDGYEDSLIEELAEALADAPLYAQIAVRKIEDWQTASAKPKAEPAQVSW